MNRFLNRLAALFRGRRPSSTPPHGSGFLVFQHTGDVILAERRLREAGFATEIKGPPPELRTGCDMVIVIDLMQEPRVRRLLEEQGPAPLRLVPVSDPLLEPVSLFQVKDFGRWYMVRAANMKITIDRATGEIVNVSGGGCPLCRQSRSPYARHTDSRNSSVCAAGAPEGPGSEWQRGERTEINSWLPCLSNQRRRACTPGRFLRTVFHWA